MSHDLDSYLFYDAGPGASVTEDASAGFTVGWRTAMSCLITDGIVRGRASSGGATAVSGRNLQIGALQCWIRGNFGYLATAFTLAFATNSSGNDRIDSVVLRNNFGANLIELDVNTGTPSGSPVAPAVTQNTSMWEIEIYQVECPNGFSGITLAQVGDFRDFAQGRPPGGPQELTCAATRTANLSCANSAWTAVPFNGAEEWDSASIHSTSSNSSRFTAVVAGLWRFTVNTTWDVNASGDRGIQIWLNGVLIHTGPLLPACTTAINTGVHWEYELVLAEGDYIEWYVSQDSGGALDLVFARGTAFYHGFGY